MPEIVVNVDNISKRYYLGSGKHGSLRESLISKWRSIQGKKKVETIDFWALKDVSFDVKKGEAMGIIGKNGAGKSTILKILSKITEPTSGRVEIHGRVSSLLEVGTGFHPELTGRENIYLNGTILGMSRQEVKLKFDEIVDFSGIEKFLDTPVKRYSSGMYVRLAFAVAAHLDPEILIIDEVLAVGDSEFQKKCLGKMDDVAKTGRTVIFVSHNLSAIKSLCKRAILLRQGQVHSIGEVDEIINNYIGQPGNEFVQEVDLLHAERKSEKGDIVLSRFMLDKTIYFPYDDIDISLNLKVKNPILLRDILLAVHIVELENNMRVFHLCNNFLSKEIIHKDSNLYTFRILKNSLRPGTYRLELWLGANGEVQDYIFSNVFLKIESGNIYHFSYSEGIRGVVQPNFQLIIS